jgi:hypothetical protein
MGKFEGMKDVGQLKAVLDGRIRREMGDGIYGYTLFDLSVLMLGFSATLMEREMMEKNLSLNLCTLPFGIGLCFGCLVIYTENCLTMKGSVHVCYGNTETLAASIE